MNIPTETYKSGWPELVKDNDDVWYVRLRDGKETGDFKGESVLYGKLDDDGFIEEDYQYVPAIGATEDDMVMTGGSWMDAEEFIKYGQSPIVIPSEPVQIKDEDEDEEDEEKDNP